MVESEAERKKRKKEADARRRAEESKPRFIKPTPVRKTPEGAVSRPTGSELLPKPERLETDVGGLTSIEKERATEGKQAQFEKEKPFATEEIQALIEQAGLDKLKEQILRPEVDLTKPSGKIALAQREIPPLPEEIRKFTSNKVEKNTNKVTGVLNELRLGLFAGVTTKIPVLNLNTVDTKLQNLEGSLVNHKEGASDVVIAVQNGAFTFEEGLEDLDQMQADVDSVEKMMQELSIISPAIFAEGKGYEFQTRVKKIRRAIIARKQAVINLAATGSTTPGTSPLTLLTEGLAAEGTL